MHVHGYAMTIVLPSGERGTPMVYGILWVCSCFVSPEQWKVAEIDSSTLCFLHSKSLLFCHLPPLIILQTQPPRLRSLSLALSCECMKFPRLTSSRSPCLPNWHLIQAESPAAQSIRLVGGDSKTSPLCRFAFLMPQTWRAGPTAAAEGARALHGHQPWLGRAGERHGRAASVHVSSSSGLLVMAAATDQLFTTFPGALWLSSSPFFPPSHGRSDPAPSPPGSEIRFCPHCLQAWSQLSPHVRFHLHHSSRESAPGFPFSAENEHAASHLPLSLSIKRSWHNRCFPPRCLVWMAILAVIFCN